MSYLDPGTGSYLLQMLVGGVAAVTYTVRHSIAAGYRKLIHLFRR